jgi:hypothetical protein
MVMVPQSDRRTCGTTGPSAPSPTGSTDWPGCRCCTRRTPLSRGAWARPVRRGHRGCGPQWVKRLNVILARPDPTSDPAGTRLSATSWRTPPRSGSWSADMPSARSPAPRPDPAGLAVTLTALRRPVRPRHPGRHSGDLTQFLVSLGDEGVDHHLALFVGVRHEDTGHGRLVAEPLDHVPEPGEGLCVLAGDAPRWRNSVLAMTNSPRFLLRDWAGWSNPAMSRRGVRME